MTFPPPKATQVVFRLAAAAVLMVLLTACVGLHRPNPVKELFAFNVERQAAPRPTLDSVSLLIERPLLDAPYDGNNFVYRTGEFTYETDYYSEFVVAPATLLHAAMCDWLESARLCEVVDATHLIAPTHVLRSAVPRLYGDFRDRGKPRAVIEWRAFLVQQSPAPQRVVMHRTYRMDVPVDDNTPAALFAGWNQALEQTLTALEGDLAGALTAGKN